VELHRTSGRAGLGFLLAGTTMVLWAALPIALSGVLVALDPFTITWARFVVSAATLFAFLAARGNLPTLRGIGAQRGGLLATATLFLAVNYAAYLVGLDWSSAADAQVLIQLGPILLSVGGILVFRESFTRAQWMGLAVLVSGVGVFVVVRLGDALLRIEALPAGMAMIVFAAIVWAVYGLAQKQLLHTTSSVHVLFFVYVGCALVFTPFAAPHTLSEIDGTRAAILAFCALNTVVGYGAFAESLALWEASRVGAVLALTPIGTLALAASIDALAPAWEVGQTLSVGGWLGALLVVAGSLAVSLGAERRAMETPRVTSDPSPES
jgi:drug/metabolite transporter (DMT)-like permease